MYNITITEESAIGEVRRFARKLAEELQFSEIELANVAIIATEAAKNLIKHTPHGGEIILQTNFEESLRTINLLALDKGHGISNLSNCLKDGYSTAGISGTGLGAIKRLSSQFDIFSVPDLGTVLWSEVAIDYPSKKQIINADCNSANLIDNAAICIPIRGESVCGDGFSVKSIDKRAQVKCIVVDGLGHGIGAHEAANEAIKIFNDSKSDELSLMVLFEKIHKSLNKTRGAAVAIAKLDLIQSKLEYVGVGNIATLILSKDFRKSLVSMNGIVGHGIKRIQSFEYSLPKQFVLIMHSDGVISQMDINQYPDLFTKSASIIAGVLYRDYKRNKDDATIVVMKKQ